MEVSLEKLFELTGAVPMDNVANSKMVLENYCTGSVAVVTTNKATSISHGTHSHNSYEFVISKASLPFTVIDNKMYTRNPNSLFAVNPMQEHGIAANLTNCSLCGIHVSKDLVHDVAAGMYDSSDIVFSNASFEVNHDLHMLVQLFLEELRYKQTGYEYMVENLSMLIIGNMLRQIRHSLSSKPDNIIESNEASIKAVIDYMNENYTAGVSCAELAELIKMNKFAFIRYFKSKTSKTPYEYLLDMKIEKAKKMLESNGNTITEISMMCGFSSHSHFTSTFRKKTGLSPTEYRMNS